MLRFDKPPVNKQKILEINDNNLSPDYFTTLLFDCNKNNYFHIPMSLHPLFYHNDIWDLNFNNRRKISVFMIGCIDKKAYSVFDSNVFKMENRSVTYEYLKGKKYIREIKSKKDLDNYIGSNDDFACIIIRRKDFEIKMKDLRKTISKFSFYLVLPGVIMPYAHNVVEALSVGTVPIIHKEYAKLMQPELEHMKNAIIYNSLDDLEDKINLAFQLSNYEIKKLIDGCNNYYINNMIPIAVVNNIEEKIQTHKLYLQAEHLSVRIFLENEFK